MLLKKKKIANKKKKQQYAHDKAPLTNLKNH